MNTVLIVASPGPAQPPLQADLEAAGIHVLGAVSCDMLVREAARQAPDVVVCWEPLPGASLFQALEMLQATAPRPVVVFTADVRAELMERALDVGVQVWVVQGYGAQRLRPLVQLARARFRHDRRLRDSLQEVTARYEERKLVERAKGILMRARALNEEEAFELLRAASMQGQQRVGQVALHVIEAARDANAVNRAGQLRMLSQRMVKLHALAIAGTDTAAAQALLADSIERAGQQLQHLKRTLSQATFGDLLNVASDAFGALDAALRCAPDSSALAEVDLLAERLLAGADKLTAALESAAPTTTLHVVNLSGRQRMLSQRLAKQALLSMLTRGAAAQSAREESGRTLQAFERAFERLSQAPLSTPEIRAMLALADGQWRLMLEGVRGVQTPAGRLQLAQASEALLALFEQLTESYERSMQVLMGQV